MRDTARQEMPRALREEVRLVGDALGQVIAEHGGEGSARRRRDAAPHRDPGAGGGRNPKRPWRCSADALVSSWSLDHAEQVARAFACYFHLVNLAEERYRARVLREADFGASGPAEALATALAAVRAELGALPASTSCSATHARPSGLHRASHRGTATRGHVRAAPRWRPARALCRSTGSSAARNPRCGGACSRRSTGSGARLSCGARSCNRSTRFARSWASSTRRCSGLSPRSIVSSAAALDDDQTAARDPRQAPAFLRFRQLGGWRS